MKSNARNPLGMIGQIIHDRLSNKSNVFLKLVSFYCQTSLGPTDNTAARLSVRNQVNLFFLVGRLSCLVFVTSPYKNESPRPDYSSSGHKC